MAQVPLLGLYQIIQQRARCGHSQGHLAHAQAFHGMHMKMVLEHIIAAIQPEMMGTVGVHKDLIGLLQAVNVQIPHILFINDHLGGTVFGHFIPELILFFELRHAELTGGDVANGDTHPVAGPIHGHDIIVALLLHMVGVDVGTRCHNSGHLSFYQSLGLLGIFHLLADSHLIPLAHQLLQVPFNGVIGNAAHGRPLRLATVTTGQGEFQFPGCGHRILKKHFIKIP